MIFDRKLLAKNKERYRAQFNQSNFLYQASAEIIVENYDLAKGVLSKDSQSLSGKMLEIGKSGDFFTGFFKGYQKLSSAIFGKVGDVVCDDEDLQFDQNSFDLAISNLNLQFINHVPEFLSDVRRILKPGGMFIASFFGENNLIELSNAVFEAQKSSDKIYPIMPPLIDVKSAGMLLQKSGFTNPVATLEKITVDYKNVRFMLEDIKHLSLGNILNKRNRGFFTRSLLEKIQDNYPKNQDGTITASFNLIILLGYK